MERSLHNKWIAALREPGRKQGANQLNNNGEQCCLDVLCEIVGALLYDGARWYGDSHSEYALPENLAKELKISSKGTPNDYGPALADMNDSGKWTFPQIADELENNEGKYYPIEE